MNGIRKRLRAVVAVAALSSGAVAIPAIAQAQPSAHDRGFLLVQNGPPRSFMAQRARVSLAQATAIAQGRFHGRIVKAETVDQGGRLVHVIRILGDDGRVRTVRIDAETGAMM